ncbi:MAG: hypothetical protein JWL75_182 [Parcubacteria group bacterium]|nr:hypothetical protein [Parcubacteria group bacterium]
MAKYIRTGSLTLAGVLLLSLFFVAPTSSVAQEKPAATAAPAPVPVLQPVSNYKDVNPKDLAPANTSISRCFDATALAVTGPGKCGSIVTATEASFYGSSRGVTVNAGDVFRCENVNGIVCTATHPDGTADSAQESSLFAGGGLTTSHTDASGNTTAGAGSKNLGTRVDDAVSTGLSHAASGIGAAAADAVLKPVAIFILTLSNLLLGLAGSLLNWVVVKTVFNFGSLIGNSPGLLLAWGIMRDIGNMMLLFGFIFMGLATILDLQTFSAKKALPRLIIFAILMNFSLFAAEAIIDTSNALSSVMYTQANTDPCGSVNGGVFGTGGGTTADCATSVFDYGIAGHIMQSTGLASLFKTNGGALNIALVTYIGLAIFSTIGAVVMFAASIMLVIRLIVLSFIIIAAPLGFAGMAIPPLRKLADKWWSHLLSQAFFAPVLFLLIFISLKVTDSFAGADTRNSLADALTSNSTSTMGIIMIFTIVIGFLIGSLLAAKSMGANGASFAINAGTRLTYGSLTRGTNLAIGGSATAARYFQQKYAPNSRVGRIANTRILTPLAGANLDMRRLPGFGKLLGAAGAGDAAKPSEHATFGDMKHKYQDIRDNKAGQERNRAYDQRVAAQKLEDEAHAGALKPDSEKYLNKLSVKELEELHGIKTGVETLAQNLSPEQFEGLMKSDKLSALQKDNLRTGRYSNIAALSAAGDTSGLKKALGGMGKKDLENMPATTLMEANVLDSLTDKQRDDLGGSEKRSAQERVAIKASSKAEKAKGDYNEIFEREKSTGASDDAAAAAAGAAIVLGVGSSGTKFDELTREQIAKLPKEVLTSEAVAQKFSPNVLMALQEEKGKFTPSDIKKIAAHITKRGSGPAFDYINGKDSPGKIFWS